MLKPVLIDGVFWAKGSKVYLKRLCPGIIRYQVYKSLDDPVKLLHIDTRTYRLQDGEILEVTTEKLRRRFFQYREVEDKFVELFFKEHDEELEGDYMLMKHLGLLGKRVEDPAFEALLRRLAGEE